MNTPHTKYQYAAVASDMAIFTVQDNELKVLLIQMKKAPFTGMWALPGGLVGPQESINDAAKRILLEKTGVDNVHLEQCGAFGRVDRDPFGRVVSVAYMALMPSDRVGLKTTEEYGSVAWFPASFVPALAYDHKEVLAAAISQMKQRLMHSNVAYSLLPAEFTLTELQRLYEIILGKKLDKRNFRKRMLSLGMLKETGKKRQGSVSRPAVLFRFIKHKLAFLRVL